MTKKIDFFFVDLKLEKTEGAIRNGNKTRGQKQKKKEEKKNFLRLWYLTPLFNNISVVS